MLKNEFAIFAPYSAQASIERAAYIGAALVYDCGINDRKLFVRIIDYVMREESRYSLFITNENQNIAEVIQRSSARRAYLDDWKTNGESSPRHYVTAGDPGQLSLNENFSRSVGLWVVCSFKFYESAKNVLFSNFEPISKHLDVSDANVIDNHVFPRITDIRFRFSGFNENSYRRTIVKLAPELFIDRHLAELREMPRSPKLKTCGRRVLFVRHLLLYPEFVPMINELLENNVAECLAMTRLEIAMVVDEMMDNVPIAKMYKFYEEIERLYPECHSNLNLVR